jgi:cobalt-zinc-cadmium resistance protein CzcA
LFGLIGTAEIAVDPMGANVCDTYVDAQSAKQWRKIDGNRTKEQLPTDARELAGNVPGQTYLFTQPIQMRFNEIMAGARADIAVQDLRRRLRGTRTLWPESRDLLRKMPGGGERVRRVRRVAHAGNQTRPRRAAPLQRARGRPESRHRHRAWRARKSARVIEGNRRFPIVVRLAEDARAAMSIP